MADDSNKSIVDDPSQWQNVKPDPFASAVRSALDGRDPIRRGDRFKEAPTQLTREDWKGISDGEHSRMDYHTLRDYIDDILLMFNRRDLPGGAISHDRCEEMRQHLMTGLRHTPRDGFRV